VKYRIESLDNWPHKDSRRRYGQFRMTFDQSLTLVRREAGLLGVDDDDPLVLRLVCEPRHVRKDGMLRQDAWIGHPGVILHLDTADGPLEFATDRYEAWRDNVHAIGLSLQALRGVDRWGVTHGAQYAGFRALPAGTGAAGNPQQAIRWMHDRLRDLGVYESMTSPGLIYRELAKRLHPDRGGSAEDWERLQNARTMLAAAGQL